MTIVTKKDRIGASRGKLALMGVLAVVLVVVIVVQLSGTSDVDNVPTASVTDMPGWEGHANAAKPESNPPAPKPAPAEKPPREWPELSMKEILACDPLAAPAWYLAAIQPEQSQEQADGTNRGTPDDSLVLAELQQAGATIVLIANGQRIATIGERQIHVGDRIEGYQVSDITDEGVILTKSRPR
jgi:hypothetical protein